MKTKNIQNSGKNTAANTRVQVIKIGVDVHIDSYVVVRIIEGQAPQPGQRMAPAIFEAFVKKQLEQAQQVYVCYEAGPFGYSLYRRLTELGVVCYVVRPRNWDEYGSRVKTDKRDAHELALCLDRYVSGNTKAFTVVRVPTPEQEQRRSQSRQRQSLQNHKKRLAAQGRGDALYYGYRIRGNWWKGAAWRGWEQKLPAHLLARLSLLQGLIVATEKALSGLTRQVQSGAPADLPVGVGRLTAQILETEVCDWGRFQNRRQVASYTGLCPQEDSSGPRRFQGHINKHGNRRLRPLLVECLWRLARSQPDYRLVKKWGPLLRERKTTGARRKQIIVAMARQFAVDWWRVRTGRVTMESLGLV